MNEQLKGLIIQACQMQLEQVFKEHAEEIKHKDISPELLTAFFNAGILTTINSMEAVIE